MEECKAVRRWGLWWGERNQVEVEGKGGFGVKRRLGLRQNERSEGERRYRSGHFGDLGMRPGVYFEFGFREYVDICMNLCL